MNLKEMSGNQQLISTEFVSPGHRCLQFSTHRPFLSSHLSNYCPPLLPIKIPQKAHNYGHYYLHIKLNSEHNFLPKSYHSLPKDTVIVKTVKFPHVSHMRYKHIYDIQQYIFLNPHPMACKELGTAAEPPSVRSLLLVFLSSSISHSFRPSL